MFWVGYILLMVWLGGALIAVNKRREDKPDSLIATHQALQWVLGGMAVYLLVTVLFFTASDTAEVLKQL